MSKKKRFAMSIAISALMLTSPSAAFAGDDDWSAVCVDGPTNFAEYIQSLFC